MTDINKDFFDAAHNAPPDFKFKPLTNERAKELITQSVKWHEGFYLPAEQKETERLGRPLTLPEQTALYLHLKYGI